MDGRRPDLQIGDLAGRADEAKARAATATQRISIVMGVPLFQTAGRRSCRAGCRTRLTVPDELAIESNEDNEIRVVPQPRPCLIEEKREAS
jgi:hypothetical protein